MAQCLDRQTSRTQPNVTLLGGPRLLLPTSRKMEGAPRDSRTSVLTPVPVG